MRMKVKYVGAKPTVSQHGVSFDQSKPDKYTFINPAIELIEAIENFEGGDTLDLREWEGHRYKDRELLSKVESYCENIENLNEQRENEVAELIRRLEESTQNSDKLTSDEKRAYMGNIKIMRGYYMQYVTNDLIYGCLLRLLADKITKSGLKKIYFPLKHNYGLVLSHLQIVLRDHKPPRDSSVGFEERDGSSYGTFDTGIK
jgi:hypothetical protein